MRNRKGVRAKTNNSTVIVEDDKCKSSSHIPIFIPLLSTVQVILYITFLTTDISDSLLEFNYKRRYEVWRYFTLALVHDGALHLLTTLLTQILYGIQLEKLHGWKKVALLFFGGTCFGELLAASINTPGAKDGAVGASGGVSALIMGYLVSTLLNGKGKKCLQVLALANVLVEALTLIGCSSFARKTEYCILYKSMGLLEISSYFANSGGKVAGILIGILIFCKQSSTYHLVIKRICLLMAGLLIFACVCINCRDQGSKILVGRTAFVKEKLGI